MQDTPESSGLALENGITGGARKCLLTIGGYPNGATDSLVQLDTKYKATSRKTYVAELKKHALIERNDAGRWACTESGRRQAGPALSPAEMRARLPEGERAILDCIFNAGDRGATDALITLVAGYKASSRKTYLGGLALRELVTSIGGRRRLTALGAASYAGYLPRTLKDHALELPEGEALIVEALRAAGGMPMAAIGEATMYKPTSVKTYVGNLVTREMVVKRDGGYDLTPELLS